MKNILIFSVIILFLVLLGIGLYALNNELAIKPQAQNNCPIPVISETSCPTGQKASLTKNTQGCYEIACN
jgi:hypothetical protein